MLDYNIQKKRTLYVELRMRGEMKLTYQTFLLNGETSDTNDNVKTRSTQSTWNPTMTWHTWWTRECAGSVSLLSPWSGSAVTLIPCTHRTAQDVQVFVSSHPCMKWAFPLTSLISSSPSSSFSHSSSTSSSSCYPSSSLRLSSKIPCATSPRRWGQLTSPSPTHFSWLE